MARASSLLSLESNFRSIISILVEQSLDITHSDLSCLYIYPEQNNDGKFLQLAYQRGRYPVEKKLPADTELIEFLFECEEAVILMERKKCPFEPLLLHEKMRSGIALPLITPQARIGVLFLNSQEEDFYNHARFLFLDAYVRTAGGLLHNSRLMTELREYLREIETLRMYQDNIFASMTNLLVTTDRQGNIRFFNEQARRELALEDEHVGQSFLQTVGKGLSKEIKKAINLSETERRELLGLEGIMKGKEKDMDFALNISPLKSNQGRFEGLTLIFTDQTKERELKEQMHVAVEERRIIKDMFSRYLSQDVVQSLMEKPDLVRPGGGRKDATIFFADIRGYTSFSEGKEPEYIIGVLNEYFSEAVDVVIRHKGFIDKFIGDCIMAAWGVPLVSAEEDAVRAVTCALEIQQLIQNKDRRFFTGQAKHLKIGIGMHSGPLVAGNLGSSQRMDYSVIGDTVNVAARMEGVAEADEVIITHSTRLLISDFFKLQEKQPVSVKGKKKPIQIYRVIERIK